MFSGGQQTTGTTTTQPPAPQPMSTIQSMQALMCLNRPGGNDDTRFEQCNTNLGSAYQQYFDQYLPPNATPEQTAEYTQIYDAWVFYATARVYSDVAFNAAKQGGGNNAVLNHRAESTAQAVLGQPISMLAGPLQQTPVAFAGQLYGYIPFFEKAGQMAAAGVTPEIAEEAGLLPPPPFPPSLIDRLEGVTGSRDLTHPLNAEIVRIYQEELHRLELGGDAGQQNNMDTQVMLADSVLNQVGPKYEAIKAEADDDTPEQEAEKFLNWLIRSFGDNVDMDEMDDTADAAVTDPEAHDGEYMAKIDQIPEGVLTELGITSRRAIADVRIHFMQVDDVAREDSRIAPLLAALTTQTEHDNFFNPIRDDGQPNTEDFVDKYIAAAAPIIAGLQPNEIHGVLQQYDAVPTFAVNGGTVTITKIELVKRETENGLPLPPEYIAGVDANRSILRYSSAARVYYDGAAMITGEDDPAAIQAALNEPVEPGSEETVQDRLVYGLIGDIMNPPQHPGEELSDEELSLTEVTRADAADAANPTDLAITPTPEHIGQTDEWGEAELRTVYMTLLPGATEAIQNAAPQGQTVDPQLISDALDDALNQYMHDTAGRPHDFTSFRIAGAEVRTNEDGSIAGIEITIEGSRQGETTQSTGIAFVSGPHSLSLGADLFAAYVRLAGENDFTAFVEPFLQYSYMPDDSIFGFRSRIMFSFYRFCDMVTPAGQNSAFEVVEGDAEGIILKELSLDAMFRWDGDDQRFHIIGGFPNLRPFPGIDAAALGETPWWYGTRDIAGSQRPLAAMLRYENNWDNGSSIGVQAFVGSGKTWMSLNNVDRAVVVDGANVGGAASGQLALDPVVLSLIFGGNYIVNGTYGGDSSLTGEFGMLWNINDDHSLGVGFRYERNSFGGVGFNEFTPAVNYHGVVYSTPTFQDEVNVNLSYVYSDREITIGGDPGDICGDMDGDTIPDPCPMSATQPLPQAGLGIVATNRLDFPWFYIDLGFGLMVSGQGNGNLGFVPVPFAGFGINHDFLGGNSN